MRIRAAAALLLAALLAPQRGDGFSSLAGARDNHREITRAAIDELNAGSTAEPYPDMARYAGWFWGRGAAIDYGVVNGSADESAHHHPYNGRATWRGEPAAWRRKYREEYEEGSFETAYNTIGHFIHLVEDDCSCPHIYVIDHDWDQWDDFEFWLAPAEDVPRTDPGASGAHASRYPFTQADYEELQYRPGFLTLGSEFVSVPEGRRFWLRDDEDDDDGDETPHDRGENTRADSDRGEDGAYSIVAGWGSYGGQYRSQDRLPGMANENGDWFGLRSVRPQARRIVLQQMWEAKEAAKADLGEISRTLPPLARGYVVGDGSVEAPTIDRDRGTPIRFEVFENRTPDVFVTIQIEDVGAIRDAAGTVWNRRPFHIAPGTREGLTFVQAVDLVWKGELENGQNLHDARAHTGRYVLRLIIEDADGRWSPNTSKAFEFRRPSAFGHYRWDVYVENEKPYVRGLEVVQPPAPIYNARWREGAGSRTLAGAAESLPIRLDGPDDDELILFEATFNNDMQAVTLRVEDVDVAMRRHEPKVWRGDCRLQNLRAHAAKPFLQVAVEGTDTDGATLDSRPGTIALVRNGRMQDYEYGTDRSHRLKVLPSEPPFVQAVEVRQNGRAVYRAHWEPRRTLTVDVREDLGDAAAEIDVEFSRDVAEDSVNVNVGATTAEMSEFRGRRWTGRFDAKAALEAGAEIEVAIRAATANGLALDADPTTAPEFNRRWTRYEQDRRGTDTGAGGEDTWHVMGALGDSWVIVLDASGSMKDDDKIGRAKEAIRAALAEFPKNDEVALIVFTNCNAIKVEREFTRDRDRVAAAADAVQPSGATPYWDSLRFAQAYLARHARGRVKHDVLMFSDGEET